MRRPPHPPQEPIMGRRMGRDIAWIGLLMGVVSLAMGYWVWRTGDSADSHWRTIVFTVLTLSQMGNAMAVRSERESLFQLGLFSNPALLASVALTFILQTLVVYWPPLQKIFKTAALSGPELLTCLALSSIVFSAIEFQKFFQRHNKAA
ncbi:MAG: cation transporting ATPase C-terminal domain-containing protein [Planctomycetaceae bacterium]|nr:cation transporting ATPase C-terminal domain-containing protein [Planctomycetaceae bacterium]